MKTSGFKAQFDKNELVRRSVRSEMVDTIDYLRKDWYYLKMGILSRVPSCKLRFLSFELIKCYKLYTKIFVKMSGLRKCLLFVNLAILLSYRKKYSDLALKKCWSLKNDNHVI